MSATPATPAAPSHGSEWTPEAHAELERKWMAANEARARRAAQETAKEEGVVTWNESTFREIESKIAASNAARARYAAAMAERAEPRDPAKAETGQWTLGARLELEGKMDKARAAESAAHSADRVDAAAKRRAEHLAQRVSVARGLRHHAAATADLAAAPEDDSDSGKWTTAARLELEAKMAASKVARADVDDAAEKLAAAVKRHKEYVAHKVAIAKGLASTPRSGDGADHKHAAADSEEDEHESETGRWTLAARLELEQKMAASMAARSAAEGASHKFEEAARRHAAAVAEKRAVAKGLSHLPRSGAAAAPAAAPADASSSS